MTLLDGTPINSQTREKIKYEIDSRGLSVCLAVILAGEDPASISYVATKEKACAETGIKSKVFRLPDKTKEDEILKIIDDLNRDNKINGILVQHPVPGVINENRIFEAIDPKKDVDCFHPYNMGKLFSGDPVIIPCTPMGIIRTLEHYNIEISGKSAVILGRSNIVGKPTAMLLMNKNATVTVCHSKTVKIESFIRNADIVVAAIGKPCFVKAEMIKEGAVLIDVGINRVPDPSSPKGYRLKGDVDFESAAIKAGAITPVPGGIGKVTVAMLLENVIKLARLQGVN